MALYVHFQGKILTRSGFFFTNVIHTSKVNKISLKYLRVSNVPIFCLVILFWIICLILRIQYGGSFKVEPLVISCRLWIWYKKKNFSPSNSIMHKNYIRIINTIIYHIWHNWKLYYFYCKSMIGKCDKFLVWWYNSSLGVV